mgnify:CR=1 FL=1
MDPKASQISLIFVTRWDKCESNQRELNTNSQNKGSRISRKEPMESAKQKEAMYIGD